MPTRLCALSVDLDEVDLYRGLHGLPQGGRSGRLVHELALDRFAAFACDQQVPLTLFAVGRELERAQVRRVLGALAAAGHEVENHSYDHRYDLLSLAPAELRQQLVRAHDAIAEATGRAPVGFRSPGYALDDRLLDELEALGYRFDSSLLASPGYYAVKAGVMLSLWLRRRPTLAVLGDPRAQLAPASPFRPGRPWHRPGQRRLLELPVQVTPWLRIPVIGTSLLLAGHPAARWLARACVGSPLVNLELHGFDLLTRVDGLGELAAKRPDLRLGLATKLNLLRAVVTELRGAGYRFVTLAQAAAELAAPSLGSQPDGA